MSDLKEVANYINQEGIPDSETMRADIEKFDRAQMQETIEAKLNEYTSLYNRFKEGEELTDKETSRMANLAEELTELAHNLNKL